MICRRSGRKCCQCKGTGREDEVPAIPDPTRKLRFYFREIASFGRSSMLCAIRLQLFLDDARDPVRGGHSRGGVGKAGQHNSQARCFDERFFCDRHPKTRSFFQRTNFTKKQNKIRSGLVIESEKEIAGYVLTCTAALFIEPQVSFSSPCTAAPRAFIVVRNPPMGNGLNLISFAAHNLLKRRAVAKLPFSSLWSLSEQKNHLGAKRIKN